MHNDDDDDDDGGDDDVPNPLTSRPVDVSPSNTPSKPQIKFLPPMPLASMLADAPTKQHTLQTSRASKPLPQRLGDASMFDVRVIAV